MPMKFLIVLIISTFSVPALGQKLDRKEIRKQVRSIISVPLEYQGKEGVWFPKKDAELLLDLVSTRLKLTLDTIDNQDIQIQALQSAVDAYKLSNQSYLELSTLNKDMFDTAMKHLPDLNPPEPAWYESSTATFVYGIMVGGAVVFGTTYLSIKALEK